MQRRKAAAVATVAGLVLAGSLTVGAAPGYASTAHTGTPVAALKAPKSDGARALCRRVPRLEKRINRAVGRLQGGAGTRGSIARLQDRVDNATKADHTAVAKFLGDRLSHRKALLPDLQQRRTDLKAVADWCLKTRNTSASGAPTISSAS